MAQNNNTFVQRHELEELLNRMDWVDEERRKANKKVAELEQLVTQQGREIISREQRIKDLETRLVNMTGQLSRITQLDATLQQFKDDMVSLIEQYDQRRITAGEDIERMRRMEKEVQAREFADIRRELPEIGRLRTDMELRQAEEARLSSLISKLQTRIPPLENRIETWERDLAFITDRERQWAKNITDIEAALGEANRRIEPILGRMDILTSNVLKAETNIQDLTGLQAEVRQTLKSWVDQIQLGEYERNQRLEKWTETLDLSKAEMERFKREWLNFVEQAKEAQMAVQAITEWQRQFELQQRETSEMSRIEVNRMQSRWDNFLAEYEKRWRNYDTDQEQRSNEGARRDKQLEERLYELAEQFKQMLADKETLWRVQAAQLEAIKQIPRVWMEEVEKAQAHDPNRRRQPALIPVNEDLY
jgi:hypothetical protein